MDLLILLHYYFYLPIFHLKRQFYFCFVIIFIKLRNFEALFVFTVFSTIWQKWHMTALIRTMDLTVQNTFFSCIHTVFLPGIATIKCSPGIRIGIHCSELARYFSEGSHNFNTIYFMTSFIHFGFFESIFAAIGLQIEISWKNIASRLSYYKWSLLRNIVKNWAESCWFFKLLFLHLIYGLLLML